MSAVGYGPLERIDGPLPLPQKYGIIAASNAKAEEIRLLPDSDAEGVQRWLNGVEVYPYPPDVGDVYDQCAPGSLHETKNFGDDLEHPQFGAMTVYVAETCTAAKVWDQDGFIARATATLSAVESYAIAFELMTGTRIPANPHLSDGNGTFPNLDAVTSVINGISLLEGEIAKSGRLGVIHCSPLAATIARDRFALDNATGVLRTINGIAVIPDFGYTTGANPTGHAHAAAGQEWMYATGPIDVRRSEMFVLPDDVAEALDRGMGATNNTPNSITYRAERHYMVDYDTEVQAAVLVDRCKTTC